MKKNLMFLISFIFLLFQINGKMDEQKRKDLLNKLTKKVSLDSISKKKIKSAKEKYYSSYVKDSMTYDKEKIDSIISSYGFPEEYNFLNETECPTVIKDQGRCGCCWSHAATTSLAYRYHKIGVEVDLSPQDALSCYLRDCDAGNFLIDPEMNLVKNGTLTEGCLPFSSSDGRTIEKCPTSCKDGSEFKKYYAQNAYMTEDYYSQETFYDIVTLMMDQIVNYGPIVTGIDVYEDFEYWHMDQEKCHNEVYTYDGTSEYLGGHAVVIVGYGYLDSKYYWLIQNSWGEEACDHGFVKVEFGNIGVEQISFVDPYIADESVTPVTIPINYNYIDPLCNLEVYTTSSLEDWKNSVEIGFKHTQTNRNFNYQCSSVNILGERQSICYYEYWNYYSLKGTYRYDSYQSLGVENKFNLNSAFIGKEFKFYGFDEIYPIYTDHLYISQEGSKMTFLFYSEDFDEDEPLIPSIYPKEDSNIPLSNCQYFDFQGNSLINCEIKKDELDYFDDMSSMNENSMSYGILCGYNQPLFAYAYKLDTTKYPVFKFKSLILPEIDTISSESILTGVADIEGSLLGFDADEISFDIFALIDVFGQNLTAFSHCSINKPTVITKDFTFSCYIDMTPGYNVPYENLYFYPYYLPKSTDFPYEIFIKDIIKGEKAEPIPLVPKIQVYIESLCPDCINFITKSFKDFYEKVEKPNLADIEFIPFGNAKEVYNTSTNKYDFSCQHGENECYGNLVETCAIQIQGRIQSYKTILCIESNIATYKKNFDETLAFCLADDETTLKEVQNCITSDMGNYYEHQMAQKTDVNHKWVPWVVVNGVHDENVENQIIYSLIDYICGDDKTKCYLN